ncbi:MAG: AMP-binding protein [Gammaproteobacteria bacterium]|nr:AMP-binding protein [Gammaproteobacteria bacterium]MBI5615074.1 AMP-binding protein [Gammaproteobacteria bacterium]
MSVYTERPWLSQYRAGVPADIIPEFPHALAMFQGSVAKDPARPFIHYFDRTLTMGEVDRLSDALACALAARGLAKGDRIAAYLQNVPQFVLTMLAAWKLGAIMVSVNPMLRHKEVALILDDSGAKALVTLESLYHEVAAEVLPDTAVKIVLTTSELEFLDGPLPALLKGHERRACAGAEDLVTLLKSFDGKYPPAIAIDGGDVALLTYTSGTTGPPKGAMNLHRNIVYNTQVYREWMSLDAKDVILGVAPLFHVTGLIACITSAMLCCPLVLYFRFDVATTAELVEKYRVTFVVASITVFIALMNSEDAKTRDFSSLKKVYSGGAPVAPATVEAYQKQFGAYIHNIYGMTETTSPTHAVPFGADAPVDPATGALSVGVPVCGAVVRIVDDEGKELPVGEIGELVSGGPMVVPGYWEKPEESKLAFEERGIHTGDVGFMDAKGYFYIVDRKKDLIIASGYKVWPREVEDVLYTHPDVRECAVVGVADAYRGETVKAFVSLKPGANTTGPAIVEYCKGLMAAYKRPHEVEIVDELPKTASGKIMRRELRK